MWRIAEEGVGGGGVTMSAQHRDVYQPSAMDNGIVYWTNPNSYMNRFFHAPLVLTAWQQLFLFSKAVQHGLAPFVACSLGQGLSGFVMSQTREVTHCSPYQP